MALKIIDEVVCEIMHKDGPDERFDEMAALEREFDHALNRLNKRPVFLDELPKDAGRFEDEDIECGTLCVMERVRPYEAGV